MAEAQDNPSAERMWYLGYGANMNPTSLSESRKVHPTKSVPCTVPNYQLSFNVRGVPYMEPTFASIRKNNSNDDVMLHGVLHEVTQDDFAQIQLTEGGGGYEGTGYNVEIIKCNTYAGETVEAKTLVWDEALSIENAYPSQRYCNLLIEGAKYHNVDPSYISYLELLPYYDKANTKLVKNIGRTLFILSLSPIIISVFGWFTMSKQLGIKPPKFVFLGINKAMNFSWMLHDYFFAKVFGSGARTH